MTVSDQERIVVASALSEIGSPWPASVEMVMRGADRFLTDARLADLARAVCRVKDAGVPPEFTALDFIRRRTDLTSDVLGMAGDTLPLSIADMEARTVVEAATGRTVLAELTSVMERLAKNPEKAHLILSPAIAALQEAKDSASPHTGLTVRSPDEILALPRDLTECLLGDRLLTKGSKLVIAGAGGTGKSRIGLQLAACCLTGRAFVTLPTYAKGLRWLVLQAENDNERLKHDLAGLKRWLGDDWQQVADGLTIHTLETERDAWLNVDDDAATAGIRRLLAAHKPDVVLLDALYSFGAGDLNKDTDMRSTLSRLQQLIHHGNPRRALVVIHHAQTGKGGLAKLTGHDRASFNRNSKVLHSWARGQINVGALEADSNDLLAFTCGKASNGREFAPFAARLDPETMTYNHEPDVDVCAEVAKVTGDAKTGPTITTERVAELCSAQGMTKGELVKAIMEDSGCRKTYAYNAVDRAESQKAVRKNTKTNKFHDVQI